MDSVTFLPLLTRWLHILSACLAIGVPLFVGLVLTPAMGRSLEPEAAAKLREAVNRRWRRVVYGIITLFILTGVYTFIFIVLPQDLGPYKMAYHAVFGVKMILALLVFFIASVLPGRMAAFAFMRQKTKLWLGILIGLLLVILLLANVLRGLRDEAGA